MLVLAVLDDPDDEPVDEIGGGGVLFMGLMRGPLLIQWLVLLPRKKLGWFCYPGL
jgi:hypothetical protein